MHKKWLALIVPVLFLFSTQAAADRESQDLQTDTAYSIVIDRFNNNDFTNDYEVDVDDPNAYHGGDVQGIIDRLDYLQDMGFTTIILSPIYEKETRNGAVRDFYQMEEHYGTLAKLKELVAKAHQRNIKVLLDLELPNEQKELVTIATWWANESNVDGFRWSGIELEEAIVNELHDTLVTAEKIFLYQATNLKQTELMRKAFASPDTSLEELNEWVKKQQPSGEVTLLDNEQMSRFTRDMITKNQHPGPRWKLALTYLYTTPGTPIVYYGTEIALDGGEAPDNQKQMDFRTDKELIEYITQIGAARQSLPSLTSGTITFLYEKGGMTVYKRETEAETTVVAINNTTKTQTATIASGLSLEKELHGVLSDEIIRPDDDTFTIVLDREQAQIYQLTPKTGLNLPYLAVMAAVYALFFVFIYLIWKRSRRNRSSER